MKANKNSIDLSTLAVIISIIAIVITIVSCTMRIT